MFQIIRRSAHVVPLVALCMSPVVPAIRDSSSNATITRNSSTDALALNASSSARMVMTRLGMRAYKGSCYTSTDGKQFNAPQKDAANPCWIFPASTETGMFYINRFRANEPFSLTRYNDGEWYAMRDAAQEGSGAPCGGNVDQMFCEGNMVKNMLDVLRNGAASEMPGSGGQAKFIIQSSLYWDWQQDYKDWGLKPYLWVNDAIHDMARGSPALLETWSLELKKHPLMIVGPCSLRRFCHKLPYNEFIEISPETRDAGSVASTIQRIKQGVHDWFTQLPDDQSGVVLISASMMTNVVIGDLFPIAKDKHFMIDIGSGLAPLIDDPDTDGKRRLPYANPEWIRQAYSLERDKERTLEKLKTLAPETYGDKSDDELASVLKKWVTLTHDNQECLPQGGCMFGPSGQTLRQDSGEVAVGIQAPKQDVVTIDDEKLKAESTRSVISKAQHV